MMPFLLPYLPCRQSKRRATRHGVVAVAECRRRAREHGGAAVEMAVALPMISLTLFAIVGVSTAVYNFEMLTSAVGAGARQLSVSRGSATPFSSAQSAVDVSAIGLTASTLNRRLAVTVNGSACGSDAECSQNMVGGAPETVQATYPCSIVVMGIDAAPGCTLTSTMAGRIE